MDTTLRRRRRTSEKVDPNKPATVVVERFGGLMPFCENTGYPTSTVYGWQVSGHIPGIYHAPIIAAARSAGVRIKPSDFVERPAAEVSE